MKEKIRKLFQGTREDMIIACSLLVQNYDPEEFIKEWEADTYDNLVKWFEECSSGIASRVEPERYYAMFNLETSIEQAGSAYDGFFYYKFKEDRYIGCHPNASVCICYKNYTTSLEVINHF